MFARAVQRAQRVSRLPSVAKRWRSMVVPHRPQRQAPSGIRATVFGAYGFTGRYVIHILGSHGTRCIIPFRGGDMDWRHLKPAGDYGNIVPMVFSPHDEDSLRKAIAGSDVVINLMGKDYETTHYMPWMVNCSFEFTHCELPQKLARICVEEGVSNFIHVSALASDEHSLSRWARAKALGEQAVRAEAPGACIVRPADMFGEEDRLLNLYVQLYFMLRRVPLVEGGRARIQPLSVRDFGRAVARLAESDDPNQFLGQTYDLAGPDVYTHRELAEYVLDEIKAVRRTVANLSPRMAHWMGSVMDIFPNPPMNPDRFLRFQLDCVLDEAAPSKRLHDLGIEATSLEMPGYNFLHSFRPGSHLEGMESREGSFGND